MLSYFQKHHKLYIYFFLLLSQVIKSSTINDIKRRIQNEIESLNNDELLEKILKSGGLSDCDSNYCYQLSFLDLQLVKNQEMKYPQIFLTNECKNNLKESYDATNLVITKIFVKNNFPKDSNNYKIGITAVSNIIFYQIFPYSNKKINLYNINPEFSCGSNIIHYNPLYINNNSLKKKILDVISQNPNIDEINCLKDYDIFYEDSKFYNDICTSASFIKYDIQNTENLSLKNYDMTLSQRRLNYFSGKVQLCPDECEYLGIDQKTLSAICQCEFEEFTRTKTFKEYSELNNDIENSDFKNSKKDSSFNFNIIKCSNAVFTSEGIKDNYGSYIIIIISLMILIYYIALMCYKNNHILSLLFSVSYEIREQDRYKFQKRQKKFEQKADKKIDNSLESKKSSNSKAGLMEGNVVKISEDPGTKDELKEQYEKKIKDIIEQKNNEIKQIIKNKDDEIIQLKSTRRNIARRSTNIQIHNRNIEFELQPQVLDINNNIEIYNAKNEQPEEIIPLESKFTNEEINNMDYESSITYDKRNLCEIYGSYLNEKHPLIFLFSCNSSSSISTYTKLIVFLQKVMVYLLVFSLCFGTETITSIYKENFGFKEKLYLSTILTPFCMIFCSIIHNLTYNTFFQKIAEIKILYYNSTISSKDYFKLIKSVLGYSYLDNGYKKDKQNENLTEEEKAKKGIITLSKHLFKYFRDKLCIDFILSIIWIFGEWYIVTAFCGVYKNSQIDFFKTLLISLLLSCIIPFAYCLFLTFLRKIAISGNSKCFYYLTKFFRIF